MAGIYYAVENSRIYYIIDEFKGVYGLIADFKKPAIFELAGFLFFRDLQMDYSGRLAEPLALLEWLEWLGLLGLLEPLVLLESQ